MDLTPDEIDAFDTELALKLAGVVFAKCTDVPADIGIWLGYAVVKHQRAKEMPADLQIEELPE